MGALLLTNPPITQFTDDQGHPQLLLNISAPGPQTVTAFIFPTAGSSSFQSPQVTVGGVTSSPMTSSSTSDGVMTLTFTVCGSAGETAGAINTATIAVTDNNPTNISFVIRYYKRLAGSVTTTPTLLSCPVPKPAGKPKKASRKAARK